MRFTGLGVGGGRGAGVLVFWGSSRRWERGARGTAPEARGDEALAGLSPWAHAEVSYGALVVCALGTRGKDEVFLSPCSVIFLIIIGLRICCLTLGIAHKGQGSGESLQFLLHFLGLVSESLGGQNCRWITLRFHGT